MTFKLEITADTWTDLVNNLPNNAAPTVDIIATMDFQELAALFGARAEVEGYEVEIISSKDRPLSAAEARKAAARAALRGDLEASLTEQQKANLDAVKEVAKEEDPFVEVKPAKKAKANGKTETPEEMKARCITALHDMYSAGKKDVVGKILADHGGGVKNFGAIAPENFGPIADALRALQH